MNRSLTARQPKAGGTEPGMAGPPASAPSARELGGRLAGRSLLGQVVILAIWPFLEQLMNFLVGAVDLMLAGRLDDDVMRLAAMDGLAVGGYVTWLLTMLVSVASVGAMALVSRAIGARHRNLANAGLAQAQVIGVVGGVVTSVIVLLGAAWICRVFGLEGLPLPLGTIYLLIVGAATPFSAILLVGAACLRGAGDTRSPFLIMVVVNLVNLVASVTFVFAPAPLGGHDVAGIAGGTALAWIVGSLMMLYLLAKGRGPIRLRRHRLRPHWHTMRRILRVGIPNLFESGGMWLINAAVLMIVSSLAITGGLGAHMIAIRIEAISFMPGFALGLAAATLVGQYLGLGDAVRAKRAAMLCMGLGMIVMTAMGIMFLVIPQWLVMIISPVKEHLAIAPTLLMICGPVQPLFGLYIIFGQALRGAGDTKATMIMSYCSLLTVRLTGAWLLGSYLGLGLPGVWFALCGDLAVKGVLFSIRFLGGRWAQIQV